MNAIYMLVISKPLELNSNSGYIIGAIIALLILGYLLYTLINPQQF